MGLNSAVHVTAADKRLTLVATFSRLATSFHHDLLTWSTLTKHNAVSVLVAWIPLSPGYAMVALLCGRETIGHCAPL
ncbi:hypothetical protein IG631_04565 [Alternaria alternata]|nr:hypothetical protein IG631_04565 [Alternaria alternata]